MRTSRKWLSRYMDLPELSAQELADKITRAGLEVEDVYPLASGSNLVIGEVLTCEPHPDSDHLHVTTVNVGDEVLDIVCGAPNVAAGQKVIVAKPGAKLPGGEIKAGSIRGQASNGMICALFELGVDKHMLSPEQVAGIEILPEDAQVGCTDPLGYLGYDDDILDIGLTPNRADCLAAWNMAAEAAAILDTEVKLPACEGAADEGTPTELKIDSKTPGCPHFLGKVIGSVTIKESPAWMKELLRAAGVHSINNVVDISNIVMLETGQPMHFYDKDAIPNLEITVADGFAEPYTALDGVEYQLEPQDLVITNQGRPIGIAGIMGGDDSKILDTTKGLIIECAAFDHVAIRNTARRLNLNTEASQRYQKGIEPLAARKALDRAVELLKEYADAADIEETVEFGSDNYEPHTITTTLEKINDRLGTDFTAEEVEDVFRRLQFAPVREGETFTVTMPSWRTDMEGLADLSEEVIRIIGYDRLPSTLPLMPMTEGKLNPQQRQRRAVHEFMEGQGLQDAVTYTLVSTDKKERAVLSAGEAIELATPMSEERRWIRTSVLPSLLDAVVYNAARGRKDIALYEISDVSAREGAKEHLAFAMSGDLQNTRWNRVNIPADFYAAKGLLEALFERQGLAPARLQFKANTLDTKNFHPFRSALVYAGKDLLGIFGEMHPEQQKQLGLKNRVVMGEVDLSRLLDLKKSKIKYQPASRFPGVTRDAALVVDESVPAAELTSIIAKSGKVGHENIIKGVEVFDVYQGAHVEPGKKSVAVAISLGSDSHTLREEEISQAFEQVTRELEKRTGARLRS